jgi:hypothetical protein
MPKGATSRPANRKEKQAAARAKLRKRAIAKAKNTLTDRQRANNIAGSKGSKADKKTLREKKTKNNVRKLANKNGKNIGYQGKTTTRRSRVGKK